MESDKDGKLVPALAWPKENCTTVRKIELSSNKTWQLCPGDAFGVYIVRNDRLIFMNDYENEAYHATWVLQDNALELVFDIGYLYEPASLPTRTAPCKK